MKGWGALSPRQGWGGGVSSNPTTVCSILILHSCPPPLGLTQNSHGREGKGKQHLYLGPCFRVAGPIPGDSDSRAPSPHPPRRAALPRPISSPSSSAPPPRCHPPSLAPSPPPSSHRRRSGGCRGAPPTAAGFGRCGSADKGCPVRAGSCSPPAAPRPQRPVRDAGTPQGTERTGDSGGARGKEGHRARGGDPISVSVGFSKLETPWAPHPALHVSERVVLSHRTAPKTKRLQQTPILGG